MLGMIFWTCLIPHVSLAEDQGSDGDTTQPQRMKEPGPVDEGNEILGGKDKV